MEQIRYRPKFVGHLIHNLDVFGYGPADFGVEDVYKRQIVYRVYADGRPDELVRGVDIVGTPLAALTRIVATGDQQHVFNGVCGAESGSVPVSAVAPAMLFSEMEVQKRAHSHERPPILPPPGFETTTATTTDGSAKQTVHP